MSASDLISFDDCSPAASCSRPRAETASTEIADGFSTSADLLDFDPLAAVTRFEASADQTCKVVFEVPQAVLAAFSAKPESSAGEGGSAGSPKAQCQRFLGTWRFKRDAGCTYVDFDSEFHVSQSEAGMRFAETRLGSDEAVGPLKSVGKWLEAALTSSSGEDLGAVRICEAEGMPDRLIRADRRPGAAAWEGEITAQLGLSHEEQAALMDLGVAKEIGRYQAESELEDVMTAMIGVGDA
mmetsp:Transcript_126/g.222  ORF Transcript_126/g.222 Transcript_126/m.222 type:complete len:240 (+) Transcript_126:67-786(+)